jgi:uncharacterized membrane protein
VNAVEIAENAGMNRLSAGFQFFHQAHPELALAAFGIPTIVFWPSVSCVILFAIGLTKIIRGELAQERGLDKLLPFGRLFYALPMGVFGTDHFADAKNIAKIVPRYMPWHMFWTYFVGTALILAALSIILQIRARLAATLLGCMFILFVAMMDIRALVITHGSSQFWAITLRDFTFSGGAFAIAAAQWKKTSSGGANRLVALCRIFVGIPAIIFGVQHFMHRTMEPGFPLGKITPAWIPGNTFWVYLTGSTLVVSGACMVLNQKARWAAMILGIVILLLVIFIYVPVMVSNPLDLDNGLNSFADTLAWSGTALVLANAIGERGGNEVRA